LNESETEYFEEANHLAEELMRAQDEKNDLQNIANALGERLRLLSQEKEFATKNTNMELRLAQFEAALANQTQVLRQLFFVKYTWDSY
jgi:hypothetical protein